MDKAVDVAIIGAGSAGLAALAKVKQAGKSFVLIDGGELGTTCARVGCMPSKSLIQVAASYHARHRLSRVGVDGAEGLRLDDAAALEHVRDLRDIFVDRVLEGSTDTLGDAFLEGRAQFLDRERLRVGERVVHARRTIIATGSRPYVPEAWSPFRDRIITTDDLFAIEALPASIAVVGLGVIGLEMGQALARMGVETIGLDMRDTVAGLEDPKVAKAAFDIIGRELPLWLGHPAEISEHEGRLRAASGEREAKVDRVLASMGRVPNVDGLGLEALDVPLDDNGVPSFDPHTMRVGDTPVFIAGDVTGRDAILHEAVQEGRIAGHNASRDEPVAFRRSVPLAITFCEPGIATVGRTWDTLDPEGTAVGEIGFGPVGRALIMGANRGLLRIYADAATTRVLGASMVGPGAEHLAHLLAWCVERELEVGDMLTMPFYHPTVEEAVQAALGDLARKLRGAVAESPELRPLAG